MIRGGYLACRLAQIVPTLLLALVLVFVLAHLLPGNPALAVLGERATSNAVAQTRHAMGLDLPLAEQFWLFLRHGLSGDLGRSLTLRVPVAELILQRLPVTAMLTMMAATLAALIAIPTAMMAALYRGRSFDLLIRGLFQLGISVPVFYLGLVLLIVLAAHFGWFPVGGFGHGFFDELYHLALPRRRRVSPSRSCLYLGPARGDSVAQPARRGAHHDSWCVALGGRFAGGLQLRAALLLHRP